MNGKWFVLNTTAREEKVVNASDPNWKWVGRGSGRQKDIVIPSDADLFASLTWPHDEELRYGEFLRSIKAVGEQVDIIFDRSLDQEEFLIMREKMAYESFARKEAEKLKSTEKQQELELVRMKNRTEGLERLNEWESLVKREQYLNHDRALWEANIERRQKELEDAKLAFHRKCDSQDRMLMLQAKANGARSEQLFFEDVGVPTFDWNADFVRLDGQPEHSTRTPKDQPKQAPPFSSQAQTLVQRSFGEEINPSQQFNVNPSWDAAAHQAYDKFMESPNREILGNQNVEEVQEEFYSTQRATWEAETRSSEPREESPCPTRTANQVLRHGEPSTQTGSLHVMLDEDGIGDEAEDNDNNTEWLRQGENDATSVRAMFGTQIRHHGSTADSHNAEESSSAEADEEQRALDKQLLNASFQLDEPTEEDWQRDYEFWVEEDDEHRPTSGPEDDRESDMSDDALPCGDHDSDQASEGESDSPSEASDVDMQNVDAEEWEPESGDEAMDTESDEEGFLEGLLGPKPGSKKQRSWEETKMSGGGWKKATLTAKSSIIMRSTDRRLHGRKPRRRNRDAWKRRQKKRSAGKQHGHQPRRRCNENMNPICAICTMMASRAGRANVLLSTPSSGTTDLHRTERTGRNLLGCLQVTCWQLRGTRSRSATYPIQRTGSGVASVVQRLRVTCQTRVEKILTILLGLASRPRSQRQRTNSLK
jgi:hypothetical protein